MRMRWVMVTGRSRAASSRKGAISTRTASGQRGSIQFGTHCAAGDGRHGRRQVSEAAEGQVVGQHERAGSRARWG